jgi:prophage regulatory protein
MEILRLPALMKMTGLSRSRVYFNLKNDPQFRRPVKLSERATGWVLEEVEAWLKARVAARDAKPTRRRSRAGAEARA